MKRLADRLVEFRLGCMLLTRIPAGRLPEPAPDLPQAGWSFPWIGVIVGLITWIAFAGASGLGASPYVAAILGLVALLLTTGAMHFDGLADFADGIGGGRDKAHALDIMRDSRLGTYGVLVLVIACLLWVSCVASISTDLTLLQFIATAALSRAAMLGVLIVMPPARSDGLGASAMGGRGWLSIVLIVVLTVAAFGVVGLGLILATILPTLAIAFLAYRKIAGQTGDILGASQVGAELGCWIFLTAAMTQP